MDLYEVTPGAIGKIYWYKTITRELSEKEIEAIRKKSMSDALNSTLTNMMYEPSKAINSLHGIVQRSWDDAKKSINMLENGIDVANEFIIIDEDPAKQLEQIEQSEGFLEWLNPYLIHQIKEFKNA